MAFTTCIHRDEKMRRCFARLFVTVTAVLLICKPVVPCLWDYDTLQMERLRFPQTLELITGKFLRHSPAYYQWRVKDRIRKMTSSPSAEAYDDLAVAYDKLGQHQKAIDTALAKEASFPGLYETQANLGTFYIHSGELEKGLKHIDAAIGINPEAHFGREIYQKKLVEYVLSRRSDSPSRQPLDNSARVGMQQHGFADFLDTSESVQNGGESKEITSETETAIELKKAITGVKGMMKFGHSDSPILLEALGDLLLNTGESEDAKRLAARAYLKASYEVEDDAAREEYRVLAEQSLDMQLRSKLTHSELSFHDLEATFQTELADAENWYGEVVADEERWVDAGIDVDAAFAAKYYQEPGLPELEEVWSDSPVAEKTWIYLVGAVCLCVAMIVGFRISRNARPRGGEYDD